MSNLTQQVCFLFPSYLILILSPFYCFPHNGLSSISSISCPLASSYVVSVDLLYNKVAVGDCSCLCFVVQQVWAKCSPSDRLQVPAAPVNLMIYEESQEMQSHNTLPILQYRYCKCLVNNILIIFNKREPLHKM